MSKEVINKERATELELRVGWNKISHGLKIYKQVNTDVTFNICDL